VVSVNNWNLSGNIINIIIKTVATRCHISKLKCTKFDFDSLQRSPDPLAGFKGPTSKGNGGEGKGYGEGKWKERRST